MVMVFVALAWTASCFSLFRAYKTNQQTALRRIC
jgi:hypothetical protein